jgi:methyl-accepting chemotaxis protein
MIVNHFSVATRLAAGFSLLLLITAIVSWIGLDRITVIEGKMKVVTDDEMEKILLVNQMRDAVRLQGEALRDLVMQEDLAFKKTELQRMKDSQLRYQRWATQLEPLLKDSRAKAALTEIAHAEERVKSAGRDIVELSLNDEHQAAGDSVRARLRPEQVSLTEQLDALLGFLHEKSREATREAQAIHASTRDLMIALAGLGLLAGVGIGAVVTRSIVRPLKAAVDMSRRIAAGDLRTSVVVAGRDETASLLRSVDEMSRSLASVIEGAQVTTTSVAAQTTSLSAAIDALSRQVHAQHERAVSVSAGMEQVSVSVGEVHRGAEGTLQASTETQRIIEASEKVVARMDASTREVIVTVRDSSAAIAELGGAVEKIGAVTDVIRGIAEQTNLLALNAAIEAARAGDQGRGFAVVADEVRVLAQRTATSTADIGGMIDSVKRKAADAVVAMAKVQKQVAGATDLTMESQEGLRQVAQKATQVTRLAESIARAIQEQSKASDLIVRDMAQISALSEENSAGIVAIDGAANRLREAMGGLESLIGRFELGRRGA